MSQQWSAPPAGVLLFPRGMDLRPDGSDGGDLSLGAGVASG